MCVCVYLLSLAGEMLISGEALWAETDPALLVREALAKTSRINQVMLGYVEINMVMKDKRADMADDAGLLVLRLFWCFIACHKAKVCLPQ